MEGHWQRALELAQVRVTGSWSSPMVNHCLHCPAVNPPTPTEAQVFLEPYERHKPSEA